MSSVRVVNVVRIAVVDSRDSQDLFFEKHVNEPYAIFHKNKRRSPREHTTYVPPLHIPVCDQPDSHTLFVVRDDDHVRTRPRDGPCAPDDDLPRQCLPVEQRTCEREPAARQKTLPSRVPKALFKVSP